MILVFSALKICLRSGSFKLLGSFSAVALVLAFLVSAFAGRQPQTLFVDFAFSTFRVSVCIVSLLLIQELLVKPLELKTIVQSLAYPTKRFSFLASTYGAIVLVVLSATILFALATYGIGQWVIIGQQSTSVSFGMPYLLMWLFMVADIAIVVAFGFLIATVSTTPYLAIIVAFVFYVVGHSVQQMADLLSIAHYIDGRDFFREAVGIVRYLVPDLSSFDVRHWSLYQEAIDWQTVFNKSLAGSFYLMVAAALATISFGRREIV